jgi:predicted phage replisome organizer
MTNKKYFWLKLKDDFFRQKEIKKLRKIAGGDTFTVIYLKMQLLSIKKGGCLYFEGVEDNIIEELALELDEDIDNIKITFMYLEKHGLIESAEDDKYILPQAIESIGSESDSAERVRKHRMNKKLLQCNSQETISYTEIEKEKEIDIEKDKKKDKAAKRSLTPEQIEKRNYIMSIFSSVYKELYHTDFNWNSAVHNKAVLSLLNLNIADIEARLRVLKTYAKESPAYWKLTPDVLNRKWNDLVRVKAV